MQPIHVEPAELDLTGRRLMAAAWDVWEQAVRMRLAIARLELTWQGGASDELLQEFRWLQKRLVDHAQDLERHALVLMRQAEMWDEMDQRWADVFRVRLFGIFRE